MEHDHTMLAPGTRFGRYRIESLLGAGATSSPRAASSPVVRSGDTPGGSGRLLRAPVLAAALTLTALVATGVVMGLQATDPPRPERPASVASPAPPDAAAPAPRTPTPTTIAPVVTPPVVLGVTPPPTAPVTTTRHNPSRRARAHGNRQTAATVPDLPP